MNEGPVATRAGLAAQPAAAEASMVARDIELVALTGARYHVAHVSSARLGARWSATPSARGLPVTCEVTPHHLTLTDEACARLRHRRQVQPAAARRTPTSRRCARRLADGTIDAIATDHAPHSPLEKDVEFDQAAFGIIGLETALPLALDLVARRACSRLRALVERLSTAAGRALLRPARRARSPQGAPADVTVLDPEAAWTCDAARFLLEAPVTRPFDGRRCAGASH